MEYRCLQGQKAWQGEECEIACSQKPL